MPSERRFPQPVAGFLSCVFRLRVSWARATRNRQVPGPIILFIVIFPDLSSSTRFVGPLNKHCKNFCERLNRCGALPSGSIGPRPPPVCQVYLIRDFVVEGDHLSPKSTHQPLRAQCLAWNLIQPPGWRFARMARKRTRLGPERVGYPWRLDPPARAMYLAARIAFYELLST